ncbi:MULTISPECIES: alpha/beta hydrolase [unclassified Streptomyces]|uniref:alpha/beta fold hydrolase n=1 Tax=unclassified Streptomyces TaxID=2593676 RepID=UPI0013720B86|nr:MULTISPECIES: alpha/beta hydrolase [unclassified Streptomyces]NEA00225.1 alpha/beta hydrolase [Streptomyces sp. SID10116]MYY84406.1 alpha/beta fold hydrolase [Streptomyces sp. SID335]MYZ17115.1 alpha/beta fold hydrolase [Streptomyces sp. SID337]NDZ89405.1 alpha/beta hydrolase [Streptomyces sp. SID10115]NDZ90222.1 alpha/beta hydrolase [Streptomyces sp. SID10115]
MRTIRHARPSRRTALLGVTAAVGLSAAAVTLPGTAGAAPHPRIRPTIVLEHGAFADASSWDGVVTRLQRAGYRVVSAANPLRGPATDAAYLRSVLDHVDGPVVLVGHSYGGTVISQAAAGLEDKVKALVYIAAFLPDTGESSIGLTNKFPGSTLGQAVESVNYSLPDGGRGADVYIKPEKFRSQFAADVPADKARLMAAGQRPVAAAALEEKSTAAGWKTIPSWSLVTTGDRNIPVAAQRYMSARAKARTTTVDASHAVSVSRPEAVTRIVERAARTVR